MQGADGDAQPGAASCDCGIANAGNKEATISQAAADRHSLRGFTQDNREDGAGRRMRIDSYFGQHFLHPQGILVNGFSQSGSLFIADQIEHDSQCI